MNNDNIIIKKCYCYLTNVTLLTLQYNGTLHWSRENLVLTQQEQQLRNKTFRTTGPQL